MAVAPACKTSPARVPQPVILSHEHTPQNLSCQSAGHSTIGSCLWGHRVNGTRKVMIIDEQMTKGSKLTSFEGVSFVGDNADLEGGDCTLRISNVTQDHLGLWSCTLITKNSTILTGAVSLGNYQIV